MNQSLIKTLLYTLMVLTGGFGILSWMENDPWWIGWILGFCLVLMIFLQIFHPKKKAQKEPEVQSVLSWEAKDALKQGKVPEISSPLKLKKNEQLYWADQMRTDYYNSKAHLFYLTNQRLVCLDEDFRLSHPIQSITLDFSENKVRISAGKRTMTFQSASPEAMDQAWKLIESERNQTGRKTR